MNTLKDNDKKNQIRTLRQPLGRKAMSSEREKERREIKPSIMATLLAPLAHTLLSDQFGLQIPPLSVVPMR
jgi:hypothetical protein